MSNWTRGRQGRPIASIVTLVMLVSFLLTLAPPRAHAQNIFSLLGQNVDTPTPVVVLDFDNNSGYKTGMLGRTYADALTIELLNTRMFEVVERQQVEELLKELNLTVPFSNEAQSMVADRLKCPYAITGTIDSVKIHKSGGGVSAEVKVKVLMLSRVTRKPINGAIVTLQSSPKIGYKGNSDVLVHEALTTAAYEATKQLLDNRLAIGKVLSSPRSGEVTLRGGHQSGFREGQELITVRRESVTGRIRLTDVASNQSVGIIIDETNGIAPGDNAVAIFQPTNTKLTVVKKANKAGVALGSLLALGVLASLAGTNGNTTNALNPGAPVAATISNASLTSNPDGGIRLTWKSPSDQVVCYVIFRDGAGFSGPIDVVLPKTMDNEYIDSGTLSSMIARTQIKVTGTIDPLTGTITSYTKNGTPIASGGTGTAGIKITDDGASLEINGVYSNVVPGNAYSYKILPVIADYMIVGTERSTVFKSGQVSSPSPWATCIAPPVLLDTPDSTFNQFSCRATLGANDYIFQASPDATFPVGNTYEIRNLRDDGTGIVRTNVQNLNSVLASQWPDMMDPNLGLTLYWRFGARMSSQTPPAPWGSDEQHTAGFVYPFEKIYLLAPLPPPNPAPPMGTRSMTPSTGGASKPGFGTNKTGSQR